MKNVASARIFLLRRTLKVAGTNAYTSLLGHGPREREELVAQTGLEQVTPAKQDGLWLPSKEVRPNWLLPNLGPSQKTCSKGRIAPKTSGPPSPTFLLLGP